VGRSLVSTAPPVQVASAVQLAVWAIPLLRVAAAGLARLAPVVAVEEREAGWQLMGHRQRGLMVE
jgi:hypothetical protein